MGRVTGIGLLLVACVASACSSSSHSDSVDLPHFQDISSAPPAIQKSARAVVRIEIGNLAGTGSFISSSGLLLTNNHVLGAPICAVEGCDVRLSFEHQRGMPPQDPVSAFAVPKAVDLGLDVAALQIFERRGGSKLQSPDFLSFDSRSATDLLGTRVFVVGHPEDSLKHWTEGTVVDTDGAWFEATNFILPGDSGSPTLDDQGNIVGIIHRGPAGEDLVTTDGVETFTLGTPSASVLAVPSGTLPKGMISVAAATTTAEVVANDQVFLNAEAPTALIDGKQTTVISLLAQACDTALARTDFVSIDDMQEAFAPCFDAMSWLECRTDLQQPSPSSTAACTDPDAWAARFQQLSETERALNGQISLGTVSFAIAALSSTRADGRAAARASLLAALTEAQTPMDLSLTPYLTAFDIDSYAGVDVLPYVRNYRQVAHYELSASDIANAAGWLCDNEVISQAELGQILTDLDHDPNVSLGSKLLIEELGYEFSVLD